MKKLLVTGGNGQLGKSLRDKIGRLPDIKASFIDIDDLDLSDKESVNEYFKQNKCDILINCAAYTAVDKAETEPEKARAINSDAVKNIALAAKDNKFRVIHISTDYVFDGSKNGAYRETETPNPQSVYGKTKLEGENGLLEILPESIIIRTAWLYSKYGKNFFLTMKNKALKNEEARVVDDQSGTPTNAADLANAILDIVSGPVWEPGIYHFSNLGETTWYDFTCEIYRLMGEDPDKVSRIKTSELNCLAQRPKSSILDKSKIMQTFNISIPDWKVSLKNTVKESLEEK